MKTLTSLRRRRVTILYRNGTIFELTCSKFTVRTVGGVITAIEWTEARPQPLHVGIDDILAVWSR